MEMKKTIRLFLIAGLALLAFSCQKADKYSGQEIRFTASAEPQTKTAYGPYNADDPNSATQQAIHWEEGDQIVIVSDKAVKRYNANQHYSVYDIVDINPNSPNKAKLDNPSSDPNGLVYDENYTGEEDYGFMAIYPATSEVINGVSQMLDGNIGPDSYIISIPGNQSRPEGKSNIVDGNHVTIPTDMSYAYMLAEATGKPWMAYHDYTETINLQFYPAFTAFEITLTAAPAFDGEKIPLTSVELLHHVDLHYPPENEPVSTVVEQGWAGKHLLINDSYSYERLIYTFPSETYLEAGKTLTFTVIALPISPTKRDYNDLKLVFTLGDGQVRTAIPYDSSGYDLFFDPRMKHRLYGLAVPGGFKMFATEAELLVEAHQESEDIIEFE